MKNKIIKVIKLLTLSFISLVLTIMFTNSDKYIIGNRNLNVLLILLFFFIFIGTYGVNQIRKNLKTKGNILLVIIGIAGISMMVLNLKNFMSFRKNFRNTVVTYADGACIDFKSECVVELLSKNNIKYTCGKGDSSFHIRLGKLNLTYKKAHLTEFKMAYKIIGSNTMIQYLIRPNIILENNRLNNDLSIIPYRDCSTLITDFTKVIRIKAMAMHKNRP